MNDKVSALTIKSLNVNSIGKQPKRGQVFQFLRKKNADIYVLVDTRIDPQIEHLIKAEWGGQAFFNSFSSQSRGIAILFRKNLCIDIINQYCDQEGNCLQLIAKFDALYGPNTDEPDFYQNIVFKIPENWNPDYAIFGGDWNLVLNQDLDTHNYLRENNTNAREIVKNQIEQLDLVDVWRNNNLEVNIYTWFKRDATITRGHKCARLDFFLITENLCPYVSDCLIEPAI